MRWRFRLRRSKQADVKAVGGIKGERIEEAEPRREEFFVVHEGVEGGGTVHGQDGAFQIHLTPTFGSVGNVRRPEVRAPLIMAAFTSDWRVRKRRPVRE